jgi:hypothetical protein
MECILASLFSRALSTRALAPVLRLAQRALDGRCQARQIMLEHIIGGAFGQRLDGRLLAHGAGDEDKRNLGTPFLHQPQGRHAVVHGQLEIRQDNVMPALLQGFLEFIPHLNPGYPAGQVRLLDLGLNELRIRRVIFQV